MKEAQQPTEKLQSIFSSQLVSLCWTARNLNSNYIHFYFIFGVFFWLRSSYYHFWGKIFCGKITWATPATPSCWVYMMLPRQLQPPRGRLAWRSLIPRAVVTCESKHSSIQGQRFQLWSQDSSPSTQSKVYLSFLFTSIYVLCSLSISTSF